MLVDDKLFFRDLLARQYLLRDMKWRRSPRRQKRLQLSSAALVSTSSSPISICRNGRLQLCPGSGGKRTYAKDSNHRTRCSRWKRGRRRCASGGNAQCRGQVRSPGLADGVAHNLEASAFTPSALEQKLARTKPHDQLRLRTRSPQIDSASRQVIFTIGVAGERVLASLECVRTVFRSSAITRCRWLRRAFSA